MYIVLKRPLDRDRDTGHRWEVAHNGGIAILSKGEALQVFGSDPKYEYRVFFVENRKVIEETQIVRSII